MVGELSRTPSTELFEKPEQAIPGAVKSLVRPLCVVEGQRPFSESGRVAFITNVEGHTFVEDIEAFSS